MSGPPGTGHQVPGETEAAGADPGRELLRLPTHEHQQFHHHRGGRGQARVNVTLEGVHQTSLL